MRKTRNEKSHKGFQKLLIRVSVFMEIHRVCLPDTGARKNGDNQKGDADFERIIGS